jgi:ribosome-binding factor A
VPELHFRYDPSLAEGSEMLRLLQEIRDVEGG